MKFTLLLLVIIGFVSAEAQTSDASAPARALTVCEVLAEPLKYDGQMLTIRGSLDGSGDGAWLTSTRCPDVMVTDGHVWPVLISLQYPDHKNRLHPVTFKFDAASERRIGAKYRELARSADGKCLVWTYTGVFETRRDWSTARAPHPGGPSPFVGFGHLGVAPAQLLLKSADDVEAVPGCSPPAKAAPGR
jgi:hypothetical protein